MDFFTRRMSVTNSKSGETRELTHFQYVSWPDYGVPVMADTMLNFRNKVRARNLLTVTALNFNLKLKFWVELDSRNLSKMLGKLRSGTRPDLVLLNND